MKAITEDEPRFITSAIKGFMGLVTPDISDDYYFDSMDAIDDEAKREYDLKLKVYLDACKEADCTDVIDKPSNKPTVDTMLEKYAAVQSLFERKGLLLEQQIDEGI